MDEDELGSRAHGTLEQLEVRGHPGRDPRHLGRAGDLKPVRAVIIERADVEQLVAEGDDLVAASHLTAP